MTVNTESPRKIILAGALGAPEMTSLVDYCRRLHDSGLDELCVDVTGIVACDRAGLDGLRVLTSRPAGLAISVEGVRWDQFATMLRLEPIGEVQGLCDSVRALMRSEPSK